MDLYINWIFVYKMQTFSILFAVFGFCSAARTEKDLLKHLFKDYDPRARPVHLNSEPVIVNISYYLLAVEDMSERQQILKTYGWLNMFWIDESLKWDPAEWDGIDELVVPVKDVWRPDTVIRNSASLVYGNIMDQDEVFRVQITPDGTVDMWTSGDLQTSCQVDMTYFPFDDQACMIQVDSWSSSTRKVTLMNQDDNVNMDNYRASGQWKILDTEVVRQTVIYTVEEFDYLRFFIYLQRKPMYFVYNIVLPSVLLSLLVLLIFRLPADAGEKMSLGITILLSFTVFQLVIADSMPETSDYVPLIAIYVLCTMLVTALSLLLTVAVMAVHYHDPNKVVPPCLTSMARCIAKMLCMKTSINQLTDSVHPQPVNPPLSIGSMIHMVVENFSGLNSDKSQGNHDEKAILRSIAENVEFLRKSREEDDTTELHKEKWMEVARILDRLFLVFFLVMILTICIVLFVIYPLNKPERPVLLGFD